MAHVDSHEVQKAASHCLSLYDSDSSSSGAAHAQSQRFLNPAWPGLDEADVPLPSIVEALARSQIFMEDILNDKSPAAKSFLHWVSGFRSAWVSATEGQLGSHV